MKLYALNVIQGVEWRPSPGELEEIMAELSEIRRDLEAQEAWVFGKALEGPEASTVVWCRGEETVARDGPWAEGDEFVGGIVIVEAEHLDAALSIAARYAKATGLRVEVRPFQGEV